MLSKGLILNRRVWMKRRCILNRRQLPFLTGGNDPASPSPENSQLQQHSQSLLSMFG